MSLMNDRDFEVYKLRQKELILEAARMRLAKKNSGGQRFKLVAIYGPALAQTGRWFMIWGMYLQKRYGQLGNALDTARDVAMLHEIQPQIKR
jgi:hypothetical protein